MCGSLSVGRLQVWGIVRCGKCDVPGKFSEVGKFDVRWKGGRET